jgi:hypothetical protein
MIESIIGMTIGVLICTFGTKLIVGIWPWELYKLRNKP